MTAAVLEPSSSPLPAARPHREPGSDVVATLRALLWLRSRQLRRQPGALLGIIVNSALFATAVVLGASWTANHRGVDDEHLRYTGAAMLGLLTLTAVLAGLLGGTFSSNVRGPEAVWILRRGGGVEAFTTIRWVQRLGQLAAQLVVAIVVYAVASLGLPLDHYVLLIPMDMAAVVLASSAAVLAFCAYEGRPRRGLTLRLVVLAVGCSVTAAGAVGAPIFGVIARDLGATQRGQLNLRDCMIAAGVLVLAAVAASAMLAQAYRLTEVLVEAGQRWEQGRSATTRTFVPGAVRSWSGGKFLQGSLAFCWVELVRARRLSRGRVLFFLVVAAIGSAVQLSRPGQPTGGAGVLVVLMAANLAAVPRTEARDIAVLRGSRQLSALLASAVGASAFWLTVVPFAWLPVLLGSAKARGYFAPGLIDLILLSVAFACLHSLASIGAEQAPKLSKYGSLVFFIATTLGVSQLYRVLSPWSWLCVAVAVWVSLALVCTRASLFLLDRH